MDFYVTCEFSYSLCVCVCFTGVVAQLKTHCSRYWLSGEVKPFRNDLQHLEVVGYMAHCLVRIFFKKSPHSKVQSKMPSSSHSLTRTHEPNHPDEQNKTWTHIAHYLALISHNSHFFVRIQTDQYLNYGQKLKN